MVVILVFIQSHTCSRLDSVISFSFNFSLSVQTLKSKLSNWILNHSWYLDESPNVFSQAHALFGGVLKAPKPQMWAGKAFPWQSSLSCCVIIMVEGGSCFLFRRFYTDGNDPLWRTQELFLQGISQRDCHLFSYPLLFSYCNRILGIPTINLCIYMVRNHQDGYPYLNLSWKVCL